MQNRIVFPLWVDNTLHGFQGRAFWPDKLRWYTATGSRCGKVLYGIDYAKTFKTIVIGEGVMDSLTFGPQGVASIGKCMSQAKVSLLAQADPATVVVAYDADAKEDTDKAVALLRANGLNAHPLILPADTDPNDLGWKKCWTLITEQVPGAQYYDTK